jgi:hypothetical protein
MERLKKEIKKMKKMLSNTVNGIDPEYTPFDPFSQALYNLNDAELFLEQINESEKNLLDKHLKAFNSSY